MEIIEVTKVTVNQTDIDEGIPFSDSSCPIALACKRVFPGRTVRVGDKITVFGGLVAFAFALESDAHEFINRFDRAESVQPATFAIKLVGIV